MPASTELRLLGVTSLGKKKKFNVQGHRVFNQAKMNLEATRKALARFLRFELAVA
jgi:hypothetical protein